MTIGIYALVFEGTDMLYIGQSINIELRYATHLNELKNLSHSVKLQEAYKKFGKPTLEVIEITEEALLDSKEEFYIHLFDSVSNGFNTSIRASGGVSLGENNGVSKYSDAQIIEAVELLAEFPDISLRVLSDNIGISWDTLKQISRGVQYRWVKEVIPSTYYKMISLKGTRASTSNSAKGRGITYPEILSPEGDRYSVNNCRIFAETHGLQQSNLVQVLSGKRKTHKGWRLA